MGPVLAGTHLWGATDLVRAPLRNGCLPGKERNDTGQMTSTHMGHGSEKVASQFYKYDAEGHLLGVIARSKNASDRVTERCIYDGQCTAAAQGTFDQLTAGFQA